MKPDIPVAPGVNKHSLASTEGKTSGEAESAVRDPRSLSNSPAFVYLNEYGERDPRKRPDSRTSLGRAVRRRADYCDGSLRSSFEKFQDLAEKEGLLLDTEAFQAWLRSEIVVGQGSEHTVYFHCRTQRAVKITHPDVMGEGAVGIPKYISDYLTNLQFHNELFHDDIRLEGLIYLDDAPLPQVLISQPWIHKGRPASLTEKIQYFRRKGFIYDKNDGIFVKSLG